MSSGAQAMGKEGRGGVVSADAIGFGGDGEVFGAGALDDVINPTAGDDARKNWAWTSRRMECKTQRAMSLAPRIPATIERCGRMGRLAHR